MILIYLSVYFVKAFLYNDSYTYLLTLLRFIFCEQLLFRTIHFIALIEIYFEYFVLLLSHMGTSIEESTCIHYNQKMLSYAIIIAGINAGIWICEMLALVFEFASYSRVLRSQ